MNPRRRLPVRRSALLSFLFVSSLAPLALAQQPPPPPPPPSQPYDQPPPAPPPAQPGEQPPPGGYAQPAPGAYPPPQPPEAYPPPAPGYYPPPPPPVYAPPPPPPPPPPQLERFFRFGGSTNLMLGFPTGSVYKGASLGDFASLLIQIEGGPDIILFDRLVLGFNFGLGYVAPGNTFQNGCDADGASSCYGLNLDIGAHAEYRFIMQQAGYLQWMVPWVGVEGGFGGLWLFESDSAGNSASVSYGGGQFEIRGGVDVARSLERGWGMFLSYRFGSFSSVSTSGNGYFYSGSTIANSAEHGWFMLGVRGRF